MDPMGMETKETHVLHQVIVEHQILAMLLLSKILAHQLMSGLDLNMDVVFLSWGCMKKHKTTNKCDNKYMYELMDILYIQYLYIYIYTLRVQNPPNHQLVDFKNHQRV